jgi:hypothetical protein
MNYKKPALYGAIAVVGIGLLLAGVSFGTVLTIALVTFMVTMHIGGHGGHGGHSGGHGDESGVGHPDADRSTPESQSHRTDHSQHAGPK